jgi:hypothetical protein
VRKRRIKVEKGLGEALKGRERVRERYIKQRKGEGEI